MQQLTQHERRVLSSIYRGALSASRNPNFAAGLASQAYHEKADSGFNPIRAEDGSTSYGIFNTGRGVWNAWVRYAQSNGIDYRSPESAEPYANFITNYFAHAAPNAAQRAFSANNPAAALNAYRTWNYGGTNTSERNAFANQFQPTPFPQTAGPAATPAPTPTPRPTPASIPIPVSQGFGQLTAPPKVPDVAPPVEIPPMSFFWNQQNGPANAQPPAVANSERPGFIDMSSAVQGPANVANPANIGTYNPESGLQLGTPPSLSGDFADYIASLPAIAQQPQSSDYMFGAGGPAAVGPVTASGIADVGNPFGNLSQNSGGNDISNFANVDIGQDLPPSPNEMSSPGEVVDDPWSNWTPEENQSSSGEVVDNPFTGDQGTPADEQSSPGEVTDNPFAGDQGPANFASNSAPPQSSGPAAYDPLSVGSIGQPGGVQTVAGSYTNSNGEIMSFDPTTGTYSGTGYWIGGPPGLLGGEALGMSTGGYMPVGGGAGYGDQMSRASSGADKGFGDLGAVQDWLDSKSLVHAGQDLSRTAFSIKPAHTTIPTTNHFGWGGSNVHAVRNLARLGQAVALPSNIIPFQISPADAAIAMATGTHG